jgi:hypothetical protein
MSMLNSIRTAEENAELRRREASEQATLWMEQTKTKAEASVKLLIQQADLELKRQNEINLREIAAKQVEIDQAFAKQDQQIAEAAKKRTEKAVEFVLKKVIKV